MYYVYILFSDKLGKRYIGSTLDLRARIKKHNVSGTNFSLKGRPWRLVYYEAFELKEDALNEEKFLKTGKGRERLKYLFSHKCGEVA